MVAVVVANGGAEREDLQSDHVEPSALDPGVVDHVLSHVQPDENPKGDGVGLSHQCPLDGKRSSSKKQQQASKSEQTNNPTAAHSRSYGYDLKNK